MQRVMLALMLLCVTTACAPSTAPLLQQTAWMQQPSECRVPCPLMPYLSAPDEVEYLIRTHELIETAGTCRRMHEACREYVNTERR